MRIAVFRALQLGDLLCTVPTLRALRAAYRDAEITLIGLPWAHGFTRRFRRYLDAFMEFPGHPGMPERPCHPGALTAFFHDARMRRFDLALQLHGSGHLTNPLARMLGAKRVAGFYVPGEYCPDPATFLEWRPREHEVKRGLRLLAALGIPARGSHLEFPLEEADREEAAGIGLTDYVCVHPGSQLPSRRWMPERFAAVGDALAETGSTVVLTGTAHEAPLTAEVAEAMRAPALDLAGRTSLGGIAALIAGARLLVCNDTGVSHIAAAVGTPSVVVCCGADPARWAPLDRSRHRVLHAAVRCRPCTHPVCPTGHECAHAVSAEAVIRETREMLACAA